MNRVCINIKDNSKVRIVLNLLKELPFVEIEENDYVAPQERKRKGRFEDIFGLWENRDITLKDIRKKAWDRF